MKTTRTIQYVIAATLMTAFMAFVSGCKEEDPKYYLYFSHENHVNEYDASCADCHGEASEGQFSAPSHASCVDCHDDWIETSKITEKTCGQCHKERDLEVLADLEVPEPTAATGGLFVHTESLEGRCDECHGNLFGDKLYQVPELNRSERVRIRDAAHQWNMACDACHVGMDPETMPADHDQHWMRRHGELGEQPDNACSMCHQEQSCQECHQEMMPVSHNNLWRLKTHGIESAWDRSRCQTCHEEDSCTACHEEIRPQSHNAAWQRTHCTQCHQSSDSQTGCSFCHESGWDDHPNPHQPNWRMTHCRNCHAGSPEAERCGICHVGAGLDTHPNPHRSGYENTHCNSCHIDGEINGVSCADCHGDDLLDNHPNPHKPGFANTHCNNCHQDSTVNGVSCAACHGGDLTDNHPNPHSAGFRSSHCNSCHAGSPEAEQCEICHEGGSSVLVHEDFWPPVHDLFGDQANCSDCHY